MFLSLGVLGHAVWETLAISIPAVQKARAGTLSIQEGDEKLRSWAAKVLRRVDAQLEITGEEEVDWQGGPYIVVSNHQSMYDIPVLFQALPLSLRMAAKQELFKTPVWGKAMLAAGFVKIDRANRQRAYQALGSAAAQMQRDGISLHIAPEGTRSKDGHLAPFKRGAFEIARTTGFSVLPVAIDGAIDVHSSGAWSVKRGCTIRVSLLPLLRPSEFEDAAALRAAAQARIAEALGQGKLPS